MTLTDVETRRQSLQVELDAERTQAERNELGQFATPPRVAREITAHCVELMAHVGSIRFMEPAIGSGSFFSSLLDVVGPKAIDDALGFEIDQRFAEVASELWAGTPLRLRNVDFTRVVPPWNEPERFSLLVTNPPYVRHHHLDSQTKQRLQHQVEGQTGYKISGLAGLYVYFMLLAHGWMQKGALACWLIPSEFMDVNYGEALKLYLLRDVTLLQIHRYDEQASQFSDALVSSAVVLFRNERPSSVHSVQFSHGGAIGAPATSASVKLSDLNPRQKWTRYSRPTTSQHRVKGRPGTAPYRLGDLMTIKRGLATGDNSFFVLKREEAERRDLPMEALRPILPSPRHLDTSEVLADERGWPQITRQLFLLDCAIPESDIEERLPTLWRYLEEGRVRGVNDGYLCSRREPWYRQEERAAAPIVCTYMGRSRTKEARPFRFIRNRSDATAANSYLLLYPTEQLRSRGPTLDAVLDQVWKALRDVPAEFLINGGRTYGGGLHKLEPKELAEVQLWLPTK